MIRNATLEDIPRLAQMGADFIEQSSFASFEYSPERLAQHVKVLIAHGFIVVAEKDGVVIGTMMGDVMTPWYTHERMGIDHVLYIEAQHRNGLIAAKMIKRFEAWCKEMGAKQIRPGVSTGDPGALRLYQGLGYEVVGNCYKKEVV